MAARNRRISLLLFSVIGGWCWIAAIGLVVALKFADAWPPEQFTLVDELYLTMWAFSILSIGFSACFLSIRRSSACSTKVPRAALLAGMLVLLFTLDRAAGVAYPPPSASSVLLEPHAVRGWSLRTNSIGTETGVKTRTNSLGFRGSEVVMPKPEQEFRVLVLGDSVAFGFNLSDDQGFVVQIEKELRRRMPASNVRCINAGVAGYATWQELDLLQETGLSLEPDLVVVQFSLNDVTDVAVFGPKRISQRRLDFEFSNTVHWSGLVRAVMTESARRQWRKRKELVPWADANIDDPFRNDKLFEKKFGEHAHPVMDKAWTQVFHDLDEMVKVTRRASVPMVLVVFPSLLQMKDFESMLRPQHRLQEWADANLVPMLDLAFVFQKECAAKALDVSGVFLDEGHPNALGCRIIAKSFGQFVLERGIMKGTPDKARDSSR